MGFGESLKHLDGRVSPLMNVELLKEVTSEEIKDVVQQMVPMKAPRPDGFPVCFYQ